MVRSFATALAAIGVMTLAAGLRAAPSPAPPEVPIAWAAERTVDGKAVHDGAVVSVVGTATVGSHVLYDRVSKFYIQDADSGITVFTRNKLPPVEAGDRIRATGRVAAYSGAVEIIPETLEVLARRQIVAPQLVSASDIMRGSFNGRLVVVQGAVIEASSRWRAYEARVHSGNELITVRLTEKQSRGFRPFEVGETISVIGIASSFQGPRSPTMTWQVIPRYPSDIKVVEGPPLSNRAMAARAAALAGIVVLIVVLWNISLRSRVKRALAERHESEGRFKAVAETAPVAIFIYQDSVFRYINQAAEQLTGFLVDELIGRPFWDIVDPEFRDLIRQRGLARLRGETVPSRYEFRILRKDGRALWLDFSATEIRYGGSIAALGTAFDITDRKRSQEALEASERRFRALVEHSSDGIALFDRQGRIVWAGPSTGSILGIDEREFVGIDLATLIHPDDWPALRHSFASVVRSARGDSIIVTFRMHGIESEWRWFEAIATNLLEEREVSAVVVNYRDITARKAAEEEMRRQALHDTLTGLPNRSLYHDRLSLALAHARRYGKALAVMFVDLDLFKLINDSMGHTVGDALLREAGQRLLACVRASDTVARVGGDEFTIVVEDLESADSINRVADAVLQHIAQPFSIDGHELHVTASIGISIFPSDGDDADTLTRNADKAMYRAKETGRNNAQLFTEDMNERYRARLAFESGFRAALERHEFVLHYQPIFAATGAPVAVEALVRWDDPLRGLVLPDDFIPAAEETRLVLPLGEWVLRTACEQIAGWKGPDQPALGLSVNLSVRQFHQRDLLEIIDSALYASRLDPHRLILEITESAAMQNLDLTRSVLQQLRARGVRVAIDDFGAGHTSLMYLRQFPIDSIKIDRAFIRDVTATNGGEGAIVTALIRLAHDLGLTVTAEGVETEAQRQFLLGVDCDCLQGFLLGRPLPADELHAMLQVREVRGSAPPPPPRTTILNPS